MKGRREFLRNSTVIIGGGFSGCLSEEDTGLDDIRTTSTYSTAATTSEQESPATLDYSVDDLLVSNRTEEPRTVEVTVSPREGVVDQFTDEVELEPKADNADYTKVYPELEQMSHEARVTLDVTGFEPWSHAWQGDAVDDHLGLHVYVEPDGLEIVGKVA